MVLNKNVLLLCLLLIGFTSWAQNRRNFDSYLSKEDMSELLLKRSKAYKRNGWITLGAGPVIVAIGRYYVQKDPYTMNGNSTGGWTISESESHKVGRALVALGVGVGLCSPYFFIRAGQLKKKARLVLSDESTGFVNHQKTFPGIGIQIGF
jgi:hypothetical protein